METGHLKSFARDKAVRKWCKLRHIPITEYNQTGVTRCLSSRDDFSNMFQKFVNRPLWSTPTEDEIETMRSRVGMANDMGLKLYNRCDKPLILTLTPHRDYNNDNGDDNDHLKEIPCEHRVDRPNRQRGGETLGLEQLNSFLYHRGRHYSSGISSPNTSWTTGGRISPFITWGNLSTRFIIHKLKERQEELRQLKKSNRLTVMEGPWLRSLAAFSSRMHWRSHFIQKLESEPNLEKNDLCSSYNHLRRGPNDWNEAYYQAWKSGNTGYPFVSISDCFYKK